MTVVNNTVPSSAPSGDSSGGMGFLIGAIILVGFLLLMFFYGLPLLRNAVGGGAPQINVPDKVDVNINPQQPQ